MSKQNSSNEQKNCSFEQKHSSNEQNNCSIEQKYSLIEPKNSSFEQKHRSNEPINSIDVLDPPPPPINFLHGSHVYHIDIIGHVAAAPSSLACFSRSACPQSLS